MKTLALFASGFFVFSTTSLRAEDVKINEESPVISTEEHELFTLGNLEIHSPYSFATLPGAPVAGGYFTLSNLGEDNDRLVSVSTEIAGETQIHEMVMSDGEMSVMSMREREDGVEILPDEIIELAPGGLHIMFMELKTRLVDGESFPATLTFEKAGEIEIEFAIIDKASVQSQEAETDE